MGQIKCKGQRKDNAERPRCTRWASVDMWLRIPWKWQSKGRQEEPWCQGEACALGMCRDQIAVKACMWSSELSGKNDNCLGQEGCL